LVELHGQQAVRTADGSHRVWRPWGIAVLSGAQQTSGYSKINTLPQRPFAFSPFVAASLFNGRAICRRPKLSNIKSVRKFNGQRLPYMCEGWNPNRVET
jgi:hypothetical protein